MSVVTAETFTAAADGDAAALKACCAAVYGQEWLPLLVGESLHPGGVELTRHLGNRLQLGPADRVLDIACGTGTTSILLAQEFGCHVTGVDYGATQIERATAAAAAAGVADQTAFEVGDAEALPFDDGTFTAVICECAFCNFPSKAQAAAEMYRMLAPGGRVGITDLTVNGPLPEALQGGRGVGGLRGRCPAGAALCCNPHRRRLCPDRYGGAQRRHCQVDRRHPDQAHGRLALGRPGED